MKLIISWMFHSSVPEIMLAMDKLGPATNRRIAYEIEQDESGNLKQLKIMRRKGLVTSQDRIWSLSEEGKALIPPMRKLTYAMEDLFEFVNEEEIIDSVKKEEATA